MRFFSGPRARLNSFFAGRFFLILFSLLAVPPSTQAAGPDEAVSVLYAALTPSDDNWVLNAALNVHLNRTQEDGLKKGIPLNFVTEAKLQRVRSWWFNEDIAEASRVGRLNYSPLTRRYQLETREGFKAYDTLPEALAELGRIENWAFVPNKSIKTGNAYLVGLRLRLDVGQLSKPLQVNALASGKWEVEGDWYEWEVSP